jgi:hypothetical protein
MKTACFLCAASFALIVTAAEAGPNARGYDLGPVWDIASVQTKDGHFNDYLKFVVTKWKAQEEALKKAGIILDYKVYVTIDPRDNEPDIALATEYKDFSKFDVPLDQQEAMAKKLSGSVAAADKEQAGRGDIRILRGDTLVRELKFQ